MKAMVLVSLIPVFFVITEIQAAAEALVGQCSPQSSANPSIPIEVDIYLNQTTECAPPYYLKGTGYVQLQFASGNTQTVSTEIVELQGFSVHGAGFALQMLGQDWRNPSPHVLTFDGHKAYYNCKSL